MKKYMIFIVMALLLCGCSGLRKTVVVTHATHDTMYVNKVVFDSVYLFQSLQTDRQHDTVYVHDLQREYKYQLLRDTIRSVRIDSIPVIHTVEVTKTVKSVPAIYKWALGICIVLIVIILAMIVIRVISVIRVR